MGNDLPVKVGILMWAFLRIRLWHLNPMGASHRGCWNISDRIVACLGLVGLDDAGTEGPFKCRLKNQNNLQEIV